MPRPEPDDEKSARIARLMGELADLSGEEEALAACRREAEEDAPALIAAGVAVDLLSLESEPEPRRAARALLERLRGRCETLGEWEAVRLLDAALAQPP